MTAQNKKEEHKKVEETLGAKDETQVLLDNRGLYKIGDKWFVKISRINVDQMISAWSVIQQAFVKTTDMNLDFTKAGTWTMLFLTALPYVPGKFYQFLMKICQLQNTTEATDKEFFKNERGTYAKYISRELKTEELIDIIQVVYDQEKDRFGELLKKVQPLLEPMMKMWKKDQEDQKTEAKEKLENLISTGQKPSTS